MKISKLAPGKKSKVESDFIDPNDPDEDAQQYIKHSDKEEDTYKTFNGYIGAASTYGSFSYLKYGPLRLFSQIAQDSDLKVGRFIWIVGHSGPETAEDSRTHFGIFAPGVTQLFPQGHIINLHPWEHNEVAPALAAAMNTNVPIIAIHLTRPPVEIPDRNESVSYTNLTLPTICSL